MTGILQSKMFEPVQRQIGRQVGCGLNIAFALCFVILTGCTSQGPVFPMLPNLAEWQVHVSQIDPSSDVSPMLGEHAARFRLDRGDQRSLLVREDEWAVSRKFLLGFDVAVRQAPGGSKPVTVARLVQPENGEAALISIDLDPQKGIAVSGQTCIPADQMSDWHRVEVRVHFAEGPQGYVEVFCDRRPVYALLELETGYPPGCRDNAACGQVRQEPVPYEWQVGLVSGVPLTTPVDVELRRMQQRPLVWTPNRVRGSG